MGTWKYHVASSKAIDITTDGERIFTALENGLYIYNPNTEEGALKTALNGLSDIEISCLYFDALGNAVYIGYTNGNKVFAFGYFAFLTIHLVTFHKNYRIIIANSTF